MDCKEVSGIIQAYHEGEMALKDVPDAVAHVKGCAACRENLQKVLYDVDVAAYCAFFEELDPPEDFADQVIDALPGGDEKEKHAKRAERAGAKKRPGSSGKLAALRGERKPLGHASKSPSHGSIKAAHRTTMVRRKDEPSGVFLTDQIFGTQEKKKGLIITYCEECGERIDPADFDTGVAIQHENASYCKKCKSKVVAEVLEPEAPPHKGEAKAKAHRSEAPARAASAARRPSAPAKPVNYMKVGGIVMGVAVALVVAVVLAISMGGDDGAPAPGGKAPPGKSAGKKAIPEAVAKGAGDVENPPAEKKQAGGVDKVLEIENVVAEENRKKAEEQARRKAVPEQQIQKWREEVQASHLDKKDFEGGIKRWNEFLTQAQETEMKDEKGLKVLWTEESFRAIGAEIQDVVRKWEQYVGSEIDRIIEKSRTLCGEGHQAAVDGKDDVFRAKFEEARKVLTEYPKEWEVRFTELTNKLFYEKTNIDNRERQVVQQVIVARMKKAERKIEGSDWADLLRDEADFQANWGCNQNTKVSWNKEEKSITLTGERSGTCPIFQKSSDKWLNYEIEFELKSTAVLVVLMRHTQNTRKYLQAPPLPSCPQFVKVRIKIEDIALYVYVKDELQGQIIVDEVRGGFPFFFVASEGTVTLRNVRVKVMKTA